MTNRTIVHPRPGARVFATNVGFHDYSPAERWGKLIGLTERRVDLLHTDRLRGEIIEKLREHEASPDDYLLVSGNPLVVTVVVQYWLSNISPIIDVLYWDARYQDYILRTIPPGAQNDEEEAETTDQDNL
jgi:hypothetical protein